MSAPPGSREALDAGCICPVLDNAHGRGYLGGVTDDEGETVYVVDCGCPLHGTQPVPRSPEIETSDD